MTIRYIATTTLAALAFGATLSAQADTLYGALREGTVVRTTAGLIPHNPSPGTTDALRYAPWTRVGSLYEVSHRAPAGTTDQARQLASRKSPSSAVPGDRAVTWQPR
ncbi:MAG: hypothetical protein R3310_14230 [Candidatus Competibacteraceae bacterium]|nr:hypothetical protein [Candidatus Competibacteraceae bacterium]